MARASSPRCEVSEVACELVEMASSSPHAAFFQLEALALLHRAIGFDCAFFGSAAGKGCAEPSLVFDGFFQAQRDALCRNALVYESELCELRAHALHHRGVAVDTEVLGRLVETKRYYQELVRPVGGGHSLISYLSLRGRILGTLMLGRGRSPFREAEKEHLRRLRSALAVGLASFGDPSSPPRASGFPRELLTAREREIGACLRLGYTNQEIARALGTSPNTVRNQLAALFQKVGATTRAELVALLLGS